MVMNKLYNIRTFEDLRYWKKDKNDLGPRADLNVTKYCIEQLNKCA